MNTNAPIVKSELRKGFLTLLSIGVLLIAFIVFMMVREDLQGSFRYIENYIVAFLLGVLAILGAYGLYATYVLHFYEDRFEVYRLTGHRVRTIYYSEITSWRERITQTKPTYKRFMVYTTRGSCKFDSNAYRNYYEMTGMIRDEFPELQAPEPRFDIDASKVILLAAILSMLGLATQMYYDHDRKRDGLEIATVSGVITNEPKTISRGKSKYIIINLAQYPFYEFRISYNAMPFTDDGLFVSTVKVGDTLRLDLDALEYRDDLTDIKTKGSFTWKNETSLDVYGLRDKEYEYLRYADYKETAEVNWDSPNKNRHIIAVIGGLLLIFTTVTFFGKKGKV